MPKCLLYLLCMCTTDRADAGEEGLASPFSQFPQQAESGHSLVGCFAGLVTGRHGMGGLDTSSADDADAVALCCVEVRFLGAVNSAKASRQECQAKTADVFTGAEFVALNLAKASSSMKHCPAFISVFSAGVRGIFVVSMGSSQQCTVDDYRVGVWYHECRQ